jgi:hypothetical protein
VTYSPEEIATHKAAILELIAAGKSLRAICDGEGMPSRETVRVWLTEDDEFSGHYARAREEQADYLADEIVDIADTEEDAAKARNRIQARQWKAGKLAPKKYGDRVAIDGKMTHSADETITGLLQRVAAQGGRLIAPTEEN